MPWARLDDRYDDTRKIKRALRREPAAIALHVMAITYCNRHNTDGEIEAERVEEWLALMPYRTITKQKVFASLFDLRLFERKDDDTLVVHDYLDWNRSRAERSMLAERGRSGGLAKATATAKPPPDGGSSQPLAAAKPPLSQGSSTPRHATPTPDQTTSSSDADGADEKITDDDHRLCALLKALALERNAKFKVKSRGRWLTDMRLLRDRDGAMPEEIERAIRWVFADDFWGGVIQSPGNLREHFPAIWDRMSRGALVPLRNSEHDELTRKRLEAAQQLMNGGSA